MATHPIPKFWTQITVGSTNEDIVFDEGGGALTATIPAASYWPDALATQIKTQMDAAGGDTYTVTIADATGLVTISSTGTFSLDTTNGNSTLLVGGTNDDDGNALANGDSGWGHFGWRQTAAATGVASSHTSDVWHGGSLYPTEPPQKWTPRQYEAAVGVAQAAEGQRVHADYTGRAAKPTTNHKVERIDWAFQFQGQDVHDLYLNDAWPLWKAGDTVRCFPDNTDDTGYQDCTLSPEDCKAPRAHNRRQGFAWWELLVSFYQEV